MKKIIAVLMAILIMVTLVSCGNQKGKSETDKKTQVTKVKKKVEKFENKNYKAYVDLDDIVRDTSSLSRANSKYYKKYIDYIAPNGKPIRIMAAEKVSDEQLLKAYNVLSFYLTNYGKYDKTAVANSMADNGALLQMPNGADGQSDVKDSALMGQPLYQNETPVAGSKWYIENDYEHRDASYEEIFHMVHDTGIGISQKPAAMPEITEKIKAGMEKALPKNKADWGKKGLWGIGSRDWLIELSKEASLEQEYIVAGIDSFYGLWEAYSESDKGMWGMYVPKTRKQVKELDAPAYEVITIFLGENLTYMERIAPEFEGTFKMNLDESQPYTYKSQYLQNVRLTGDKNSNLEANDLDNILIGNKGNNTIDGKGGSDVVQFSGKSSEYTMTKSGDKVIVKDSKDRDGENTLINIEVIRFKDMDVNAKEIK